MSDEETVGQAVKPASERMVQFYEDVIPVAQLEDGRIYVPIHPIANALGLAPVGQRSRVLRDEVMAEDVLIVTMHGSDGKRRSMLSIPIQQIPGYLFGVDISRVKLELREKLIRYKRECFDALWQAMVGTMPALPAPAKYALDVPSERELTSAEKALALATAVQQLAAAQVEQEQRMVGLEAGVGQLGERQDQMANFLRPFILETRRLLAVYDGRLDTIEARLVTVTEAEASEIGLAVKNLAYELEQRGVANGYARVHSVLHRRFDVRSYHVMPHEKYEAVLAWLRSWYDEVIAKPVKEQASGNEGGDA